MKPAKLLITLVYITGETETLTFEQYQRRIYSGYLERRPI